MSARATLALPAAPHDPWWRRASLRLYERSPPWLDGVARALLPLGLLAREWQLPLAAVRGTVDGAPLRLLIAGEGPVVEGLLERTLDPAWRREARGAVPMPRAAIALREAAAGCDLLLARIVRGATPGLGGEWLRVPEGVGTRLRVTDDPSLVEQASGSARKNSRLVRRAGLSWTFSRSEPDFTAFYEHCYLPYNRARHGASGVVRRPEWLRRRFRRGGVIWVWRGVERVAGSLVEERGATLHCRGVGTWGGDPALLGLGALAACYLFEVEHARSRGLRWVDHGASTPSPRDGLLAHKLAWGAELVARPSIVRDLLLGWERWTPGVGAFLARTPLVVRDGGGLSAVGAVPVDQPLAAAAAAAAPVLCGRGLRRGILVAPAGDVVAGGDQRIAVGVSRGLWITPPGTPRELFANALPWRSDAGALAREGCDAA